MRFLINIIDPTTPEFKTKFLEQFSSEEIAQKKWDDLQNYYSDKTFGSTKEDGGILTPNQLTEIGFVGLYLK